MARDSKTQKPALITAERCLGLCCERRHTGSVDAGVCCDGAGACLETEGGHSQAPEESPELRDGMQIAALLKHPLTGTVSCEKNTVPANSFEHFYS